MKKSLLSLVFVLFSAGIFAQSAEKVTEIINSEQATYGQAAYLTCMALDLVKQNATEKNALEVLKVSGVIEEGVEISDTLTMKNLAWICANAWDVKGSLMFKIARNPRYAFKQMRSDDVIPYGTDPSKIPSGHDLLNVVTDCIANYQIKKDSDNGSEVPAAFHR